MNSSSILVAFLVQWAFMRLERIQGPTSWLSWFITPTYLTNHKKTNSQHDITSTQSPFIIFCSHYSVVSTIKKSVAHNTSDILKICYNKKWNTKKKLKEKLWDEARKSLLSGVKHFYDDEKKFFFASWKLFHVKCGSDEYNNTIRMNFCRFFSFDRLGAEENIYLKLFCLRIWELGFSAD